MWYPEILNRMSIYSKTSSDETIMLCDAINYHNNKTILRNVSIYFLYLKNNNLKLF